MTDETPTPTTEPDGRADIDEAAPQQDSANNEEPDGKPDRRDTRYRARLREAEAVLRDEREQWNAERSQMRQTIEAMQRREIERAVANRLADPADVWRHGLQLSDVVGDDGTLDADALDQVVSDCLTQHPHWAPRPPAAAPSSAVTPGASKPPMVEEADSWTDAFRPRDHV